MSFWDIESMWQKAKDLGTCNHLIIVADSCFSGWWVTRPDVWKFRDFRCVTVASGVDNYEFLVVAERYRYKNPGNWAVRPISDS